MTDSTTRPPRTRAAITFMESVEAAILDPAIARMFAPGPVLLALVSPDAIRDALVAVEDECDDR